MHLFYLYDIYLKSITNNVPTKKTEYQKGYEDGQELVAVHVNSDGRAKAKEYIKKLADKNKGKTDALNYFIDNSASYYVPPQIINEHSKNTTRKMKQNKIRLTESQLKKLISETVAQILEYNDEWLQKVGGCDYLSDEDKKQIQIASMNNWDRHEREEKIKQEMDNLSTLANKNVYDKRMVGESFEQGGQDDVMDAIIMLKEAYYDINEFAKVNKTAGLDLAEAMGNIRGALKILTNFA